MAIQVGEAYVAKSGTTVIVNFVDSSTLKDVTLSAGTGNATISINGGGPITLSSKKVNQGIVFLPSITGQTFAVNSGDTVTLSAPSGWVTASAGSSPTLTNQSLTNRTGVEHIPLLPPSGTLRMGWNVQKPGYFNPCPWHNNWTKHANRFLNTNSTYDGNGYPTALGAGSTEAIVMQDNVGGEPWDAMPTSGNWRIYWDGASGNCTLGNQGGNTTVVAGTSSTGNATNNFREYSVTVNTLPGGIKYTVTAVPVSNIRIYPPGIDGSSPKFRTDFLRQIGSPACMRFLDPVDTNSCNIVDFSDFSLDTVLTYYRRQYQQTVGVSQFEAWTNDGTLYSTDRILIKCTTSAAHGFVDGMTVDFTGATAIACNSGAFTVTPSTSYFIKVLSTTTFAFMIFRSGGGTVDAPVNPPSCTVATDLAGTVPISDMVELCNLKNCDMWINVPALATNACVTSMASYIAANLNANLRCIVEYTNEHWNSATAFTQFWYCFMKGQMDATIAAATSNVFYRGNYWYAQRASEVHDLFATEWSTAGRAASNLVRLVATQFGNTTVTSNVLDWYDDQLGKQIDAVAFAPYWGSDFVSADSTLTDQCTIDQLMEHAIAKLEHDARQDVTRYESQVAELTIHGLQDKMWIYETGADIFAAGSGTGSEKSRAVGRHPRMRHAWNWRLRKFEQQGYKFGAVFMLGHHNLTSGGGGTNNTNWSVWLAHDQVAGLGDGSDGLFNNTSDYDNHASVVSVQGYALAEFMDGTLVGPAVLQLPNYVDWLYDAGYVSVAQSEAVLFADLQYTAMRPPYDLDARHAFDLGAERKPMDLTARP